MASKVPNPERADWYAKLGKCSSCPPEPGGADGRWWRQKVYSHGHGYPPARNIWKTADGNTHKTLKDATAHEGRTGINDSVLSKAQDAVKEAPKEKDPNVLFDDEDMGMEPQEPKVASAAKKRQLREWEHFHYLPESTKKFATSED
jgi:hypothetical protein